MKIKNQAKLEFLSIPENVALARVTTATFAAQLDFTLNDLEDIKVAVSEAISNAIIHGYENRPAETVRMIITLYEGALEIIIEDEGKGIADIDQALQPAYTTEPERMGLGFVFMQSLMDEFSVKSELGKGTRVTLAKKLELSANPNPES